MPITAMSPSRRTHSWSLVKRIALIGLLLMSAAVVPVRDERHRRDMRRSRHVADHQRQCAARGGMGGVDVAHRDRRAERWPEPATGYPADRVAGGIGDR